MPTPSLSSIIRNVLGESPSITTDEAIIEVKRRGRKDSDKRIRTNIYNIRKLLKKQAAEAPTTSTSSKTTVMPKPAVVVREVDHTKELSTVLANVMLVNSEFLAKLVALRMHVKLPRRCGLVVVWIFSFNIWKRWREFGSPSNIFNC